MTTTAKTRPAPLACSLHTAAAKAHGLSAATYPIHPGDRVENIAGTVGTYRGLWQPGAKRETVQVDWDKVQPAPQVKRGLTAEEWSLVLGALESHAHGLWAVQADSAERQDAIARKALRLENLAEKLAQDGVKH